MTAKYKAVAALEILKRRRARDSLLEFTKYTFPQFQASQHHALICDKLEAVERGDINRLMIFAPPRHTKSELASKRFPAWYLGRHPERQVIACSYNAELATDFGRSVRNLVADKLYRNVFDNVFLAADSSAASRWHTNHGGVYTSTGVGGTLTGRGAHIGIIDDPIKNREEADSQKIRDSIWTWYTSTFYTRLMPGGAIVMMLTRWHEDDLAARAMATEQWDILSLPAIANEGTDNELALWPGWFPVDKLRHIRSVIPSRDWHALYQQSPRQEQGTYIRREWYSGRYDKEPACNIYIASDFAVTEPSSSDRDPDWTEHGVFGVGSDDTIYVLDWWSGQTTPDVWIDKLLDLVQKYKPLAWFGEAGVIRRAIEPFLVKRMRERQVYCRNEWVTSVSDKATRGRSFQARSSMGRIRFPKTPWADSVIEQCVGFPGSVHDDKFDTMSLVCLVIDQAHPAIVRDVKRLPRDRWRDNERGEEFRNWKVL